MDGVTNIIATSTFNPEKRSARIEPVVTGTSSCQTTCASVHPRIQGIPARNRQVRTNSMMSITLNHVVELGLLVYQVQT